MSVKVNCGLRTVFFRLVLSFHLHDHLGSRDRVLVCWSVDVLWLAILIQYDYRFFLNDPNQPVINDLLAFLSNWPSFLHRPPNQIDVTGSPVRVG
jgi:hypothetical protein